MLNAPSNSATNGESRFFRRIETFISEMGDEIVGYVEPDIAGQHPDFLLFSKTRGVLIVEVKDYREDRLKTIRKSGDWEHFNGKEIINISNPFDQIYQYWRSVMSRVNHCGFPSNIDVPVVQLVCFSQISEKSRISMDLEQLCPKKVKSCYAESIRLNRKFKEMLSVKWSHKIQLSDRQFEVLRSNITPFSRLPTIEQANLSEPYSVDRNILLLDPEQERIARNLGDGHRLVFGVAGSGKTVILAARVRLLAQRHSDWDILVLCYNRLLRDLLYQLIIPQDYEANITVNTFHSWARNFILSCNSGISQRYKTLESEHENSGDMNDFFKNIVPSLLSDVVESAQTIRYDAILIDEGQDFQQEWYQAMMPLLNSETNSLLVTCDGLQGIYERKDFYWSDVGIEARGRVMRISKSYRNPVEVGEIAQAVLPEKLKDLLDTRDEFITTREYGDGTGSSYFIIGENSEDEYKQIIIAISQILLEDRNVLVLFPYNVAKQENHPFLEQLNESDIRWRMLDKYIAHSRGVFIGTIHGTKGLEYQNVVIPQIHKYKNTRFRQLLYVAVTRCQKRIILSASKSTELVEGLKEIKGID
jgi:superfamily I DNA and RNA helicase